VNSAPHGTRRRRPGGPGWSSERRHIFGETNEETGGKSGRCSNISSPPYVRRRKSSRTRGGVTEDVVRRQLDVLADSMPLPSADHVAYEPVWAIGTGRNATPEDAPGSMHRCAPGSAPAAFRLEAVTVLYGGSVNLGECALVAVPARGDGVLVGGASIDVATWARWYGRDRERRGLKGSPGRVLSRFTCSLFS